MTDGRKYLSTRQAAKRLGLAPRTLDRYRITGGGPVYHLFGTAVRYLPADLDHWAETRRRRSTSRGHRPRPTATPSSTSPARSCAPSTRPSGPGVRPSPSRAAGSQGARPPHGPSGKTAGMTRR